MNGREGEGGKIYCCIRHRCWAEAGICRAETGTAGRCSAGMRHSALGFWGIDKSYGACSVVHWIYGPTSPPPPPLPPSKTRFFHWSQGAG